MNQPYRKPLFLPCAVAFLLLTAATLAPAQDQPHRPKIAVVLSGGGARGLAHIGVLQWMEENRIPVDLVAGASMGGVVGAMYSTGMSPEEMRHFVEAINWEEIAAIPPNYSQLSFRRKEDRRIYEVAIPLGLRHGLEGPNAVNPGQGVGLLLDRISFAYSTLASFDQLPIPFRCVATDMLEGTPVVLKDGSLSQALRATIAFPGVFTPVELKGKVLADGGLVNNIPTDVARQMGADIVIAVDMGTPLWGREALQSLAGVLDQSIGVMTIESDRRALRQADLIVAPDLGKYTRTDYDAAEQIIALGYQGAAQKAAVLRAFALPEKEWQEYLAARRARKREPDKSVAQVDISGASEVEQERLERKLQKHLEGGLNLHRLETDLTRLTGEGRFDSLGYEAFTAGPGRGLLIRAHEKRYGPPFVNLAFNVDGSGVGAFDFSAGFRLTYMDVGQHRGEWRSDVLLGSSNFLASEFYQPLRSSRLFVAPYGFFQKRARNAFAGDQRVAEFRDRRAGAGFDLGLTSGRRSELRLGYQIFRGDMDVLVGDPVLPRVGGSSSQLRLHWVFDGQDNPLAPMRGERVTAELTHVLQSPGAPRAFQQLQVQSSTFVPLSRKGSVFFNQSFGTTFHRDAGIFQVFSLGGPSHLGAYHRDQFFGNHYVYSAFGYRHQLARLPVLFGRKVYASGWYEMGSAFNDPDHLVVHHSFDAGVIAETIMGPVALTWSVSPAGQNRLNLSIGKLF